MPTSICFYVYYQKQGALSVAEASGGMLIGLLRPPDFLQAHHQDQAIVSLGLPGHVSSL